MANYKIYEKSRTISVSGKLTPIEQTIIASYISSGFTVREKSVRSGGISNKAITNYFTDKIAEAKEANDTDTAGKLAEIQKQYEAEKKKKVRDKKGVLREQGYLVAVKWLKKNHNDIYVAINPPKKDEEETNEE